MPPERLIEPSVDGGSLEVVAVEHEHRSQIVHNLTINGTHTYYVVSGAAQMLTHNCNDLVADDAMFPNAHVIEKHVSPSDDQLVRLAQAERNGVNSRFVDLQTAQQVVDYAIAGNPQRIRKWLASSEQLPHLELSGNFGANNPIGAIASSSGRIVPSSNSYKVILQRAKGHSKGYYVYSAYPDR